MRKRRDMYSSKRALTHHIEMVISFSLFVLFVFFVILFVQPHDTGYLGESIVTGLQYNFLNEATTKVLSFSLALKTSDSGYECFDVNLIEEISKHGFTGVNVRQTLTNGFTQETSAELTGVDTLRIYFNAPTSYNVFLSNDTPNSGTGTCTGGSATPMEATFGSVREEEVVSLKYLEEVLKVEYETDYENLKQRLAVPSSFDFAITSPIVSMEREIPAGVEVVSRDYIERVLFYEDVQDYEEGSIESIRFSIKLWR